MSNFSHIPPVSNATTADTSSGMFVPHCLDGHVSMHQQKNHAASRIPQPILQHELSNGSRKQRTNKCRVTMMNAWPRTAYEPLSRTERLTCENQGSEPLASRAGRTHERASWRKRDSSCSSVITVLRINEQSTKWELDETSRVVWLGRETLGDQTNIQAAAIIHDTREERSGVAYTRQLDHENSQRHDGEAPSRPDGELIQSYGESFQEPTTKSYTLVPRLRLRVTENVDLTSDSDKGLKLIAQALRKSNVQTPLRSDEEEETSQSNGGCAQHQGAETIYPQSTTSRPPIPRFRLRRRKSRGLTGDDDEKTDDVDANNEITVASKSRSKLKMKRSTKSVERDRHFFGKT